METPRRGAPERQASDPLSTDFVQISRERNKKRVVNDNVHGHFWLSDCSYEFIDTPCFQRLRRLHQLGKASLVFPTATHTRMEHSLGVAFLGRKYAKKLLKDVGADDVSRWSKIVELAGLLHDLGHGPLSHLFECVLLPALHPNISWSHEAMSNQLIDWMIDEHNIDVQDHGLDPVADIRMVKSLIAGDKPNQASTSAPTFLWDLVANHRDSLDVDKFDYLQRDSMQCNIHLATNFNRFPYFMKVFDNKVCYRLKEEKEVFNVFWDRAKMHSNVYQHRKLKGIEFMVCDALAAINPYLNLAEKIYDPAKYITLDDSIERECFRLNPVDPSVRVAQTILNSMESRRLYKLAKEIIVPIDPVRIPMWQAPSPAEVTQYQNADGLVNLRPEDIRISKAHIHYGKRSDNPMRHVTFYDYNDEDGYQLLGLTRSQRDVELYGRPYGEIRLGVYSVNPDEHYRRAAARAFSNWAEQAYPSHTQATPERHKNQFRRMDMDMDD